jgi:hypothetical protein
MSKHTPRPPWDVYSDDACALCGEIHEPERGLSYDGCGINSCDQHRSRIATFQRGAQRRMLGPMFEAAPDLLEACNLVVTHGMAEYNSPDDPVLVLQLTREEFESIQAAIAKAQAWGVR